VTIVQNDQDAERHLVASLMSEPDAWDVVCDIVFPECFTDPVYRVIADCIWYQAKNKKPFDPVSLTGAAKDSGNDVDVGLLFQIAGDGTTVESMIRHWGERLRHLWAVRERRKVAIAMLNDEVGESVEEQIAKDASRLLAIETGSTKRERHQKEILLDRLERLQAEQKAGAADRLKRLVDTGIPSLDCLLLGMRPGEPVMIAARPGIGKTTVSDAIADHCGKSGIPTAIFRLEDYAESWATRTMARRCRINAALLRHGSSLRKEHWTSLMDNLNASADWPIYVDDTHALTARQVAQRMRRMHRNHGIRVFIADHLGEMRLEREERWGERHDLALGQAIRIFRDTAAELNAVPILIAQLGRANERDDEPKLSQIFGTGEAEQIVRVAIFLKRENDKIVAQIIKNTNGPLGRVELGWDSGTMSIYDPSTIVAKQPERRRLTTNPAAVLAGMEDDD
jgi:replicative DNA helicase